jgi:hypothetical protein
MIISRMLVVLNLLVVTTSLSGCEIGETPRQTNIGVCSKQTNVFTFTCPQGKSFRFLLGINEPIPVRPTGKKLAGSKPQVSFRGVVRIDHSGAKVLQFPISSNNANRSNWLNGYGINGGYILNLGKVPPGQDFGPPLDNYMKPAQTYTATIRFSVAPPKTSSFWLASLS